jgi:hypothetical protein
MAKDKKLWVDMCAGSELKDTQGETLSVEGADISELEQGSGRLNDNHGKGFFNSLGRVTEAKKIFKSEDCENDRHKYYWEKIKAPFIYAKGYLFNDEDHPNAKAAAAILRNIHREDTPLSMKASVEGGVLSRGMKDPTRLARTKIHSVALTFTPANNATLVEPLNVDKSNSNWEADKQLIKSVIHLAETNIPSFRHVQRHASANTIHENIAKIQELAKHIGIEIDVKTSSPDTIMKNAVIYKIDSNVKKINELVKQLKIGQAKVDPMSLYSKPKALPAQPSSESGFNHPDYVSNLMSQGQKIDESHPDHAKVVDYVHALKNTEHPEKLNTNVLEARRIYNTLLSKSSQIKDKLKKAFEEEMDKALTAGYGGAGAPTDLVGGGVIQAQGLDSNRKKKVKNKLVKIASIEIESVNKSLKYVSCDNCGHEQVFMPHQVKCRECKHNFSLHRLNSAK